MGRIYKRKNPNTQKPKHPNKCPNSKDTSLSNKVFMFLVIWAFVWVFGFLGVWVFFSMLNLLSMASTPERIGGGFTEGELTFANFWVRHRIQLRQFGRGALIVINVLLWGFVLWSLLDAFVISWPRESRITQQIAENQFIATSFDANRPQNVQVGPVNVFESTDDRLDFLIPVQNPNTDWWVEFTYRFNVSGEQTPQRSGFLLPGESSYLGEFGFKPATQGARSGILIVENIRWHRTDPSIVGADYEEWISRRNRFDTPDARYTPDLLVAGKRVGRTSFTFRNPSAYGFWSVRLYVILNRANTPVAATTITLERVLAGEDRPVEIDWFEDLPSVTDVEVVPVVNYLDPSVYLPSERL